MYNRSGQVFKNPPNDPWTYFCYSDSRNVSTENCGTTTYQKIFLNPKTSRTIKRGPSQFFLQCQRKSFRELLLDTHCDIIFSVEKHFPKENIQFSSRRFFLFLQPPMTRRVQVCTVVGVLHNTCPGWQRGLEAGAGGFDTRYRPYFFTYF